MLSSLVHHVLHQEEAEISALPLEDIAIVSAWWESLAGSPEKRESAKIFPDILQRWLSTPPEPGPATEGRRQQPLLRKLFGLLSADKDQLNPCEIHFLKEAHRLAGQRTGADYTRLLEGLQPIAAIPDTTAEGLEKIEERIQFLSSREILKARPRKINYFAGINLPVFGPVLTVAGDVKILDQVPDDTILVVEDGACTINGYVLGRVATTYSTEVRENISGIIIVRDGDIRARNVLNASFVVSKWGKVIVRGAQNPKLIFGGEALYIAENANLGAYAAPTIEVKGQAIGGQWTLSKRLQATQFRRSDNQKSEIALQRGISYEEYGGLVPPEANRLLHKLASLRRKEVNYGRMMLLARDECEHFASSAMMFMIGGEKLRHRIEDLNASRRRLAFLDRVIAGIDAALTFTEDQLKAAQNPAELDPLHLPPAEEEAFSSLNEELQLLQEEGDIDADLKEQSEELRAMDANRHNKRKPSLTALNEMHRLREKQQTWLSERKSLSLEVEEKETDLRGTLGRTEALESKKADTSVVHALTKLIAAARRRPPGDPLSRRTNANFMVLMLRLIDARRRRLVAHAKTIEGLKAEKAALAEELETDYFIRPRLDEDAGSVKPEVSGRFEAGLVLCTDRFLLEEKVPTPGKVVLTRDTGTDTLRYVRTQNTIVEAT